MSNGTRNPWNWLAGATVALWVVVLLWPSSQFDIFNALAGCFVHPPKAPVAAKVYSPISCPPMPCMTTQQVGEFVKR